MKKMVENTGPDDEETQSKPLLSEDTDDGEEGQGHTRINTVHGWWGKVLDLEEAKNQLMFSLPMILTNMSYFLVSLVSVMFSGHLGVLQLAGATLANSWFSCTGADVVVSVFFLFVCLFSHTRIFLKLQVHYCLVLNSNQGALGRLQTIGWLKSYGMGGLGNS